MTTSFWCATLPITTLHARRSLLLLAWHLLVHDNTDAEAASSHCTFENHRWFLIWRCLLSLQMIDEVHTLIGAGAAEGAIDAANILKPALARGELQCIGATTLDEYRKHIEKDPALER